MQPVLNTTETRARSRDTRDNDVRKRPDGSRALTGRKEVPGSALAGARTGASHELCWLIRRVHRESDSAHADCRSRAAPPAAPAPAVRHSQVA